MSQPLLRCKSVSGRIVRLSESVWFEKILKDHPEFKERSEYLEEIKRTVEEPDYIITGWAGEYLALRWCEIAQGGRNTCV